MIPVVSPASQLGMRNLAAGRASGVKPSYKMTCAENLGGKRIAPRPSKAKEGKRIRVGSWNVGSMTGKGLEIAEVCMRQKLDILCVQETRWAGNTSRAVREIGHGYKLFYSGEENKDNGVGIILSPEMKDKVVEVKRHSSRTMAMKMVVSGELVHIIAAYAPQVNLSDKAKEDFLKEYEELVSKIPSSEKIFVGADLNCHVGKEAGSFQRIHGGKGYGNRNKEGERTLESMESLDLALLNTFFCKKDGHLVTYRTITHKTQIDFILTRREDMRIVQDCKVIPGEAAVTQHRLVCATLLLKEVKHRKRPMVKKIRTWKLQEGKVDEFREKVEDTYHLEPDTTAEDSWKLFRDATLKAAEEICGTSKGGKHIGKETWWWNEEVQDVLKKKKKAFKRWQTEGGTEAKEEYKKLKREAKRVVAKAKSEAQKDWYEKLGTKEGEKIIYKVAKQRKNERKDIGELSVIKDQAGNLLIEEEKVKERWGEYFDNLLNVENTREQLEELAEVEGPIRPVTRKEVKEAISNTKSGKATGCSGLGVDLIKHLGESGIDMMHEILKRVWEEEKMPEEWEKSEIVPIFKQKGDPLDCGNFRGIKLLEHGMKIMEKILERRLRKIIPIDNMQFGFSPGKGTIDAAFILQQLQEKHLEVGKDLLLTFVDLEKAYDRIPRDLVYWCLRKRGVPERLVRLVKATYHGSETAVRTPYGRTKTFPIRVGLHQGSGLSPFLFIVVMDVISETCREGLPWELLFADDLSLTAKDDDLSLAAKAETKMQEKWQKWQEGIEKKGLKVNTGKTEVMVCSRQGTSVNITDNKGTALKQVDKFKYLGITMSANGGSEEAVRARVSAAWTKWRELSGVFFDKKMPRRLKIKLYLTVIRPVLLYGAECWTVTKKEEQILETTEMRMLRRIKGVTRRDKVRSVSIRRELGVNDIKEKVREIRLRWYGHVMRMKDDNEVKKVMYMKVPGKRPVGRPKARWMDRIVKDMKELKITEDDTQDRRFWRSRIRATDPTQWE